MASHIDKGKNAEKLAATFFLERGYELLHQNWRYKHWEIDLIAVRNNRVHFIEVKYRTSNKSGYPEEAVHKAKIKYLMNAAEQFIYLHPSWKYIQFDVLAITGAEPPYDYFLIEDVYCW